jgi:hypothetical protein
MRPHKRNSICGDPEDRDPSRRKSADRLLQATPTRDQFRGRQFTCPGTRPSHNVRETVSHRQQDAGLRGIQNAIRKLGRTQRAPEAVTRPGKVVADGGRGARFSSEARHDGHAPPMYSAQLIRLHDSNGGGATGGFGGMGRCGSALTHGGTGGGPATGRSGPLVAPATNPAACPCLSRKNPDSNVPIYASPYVMTAPSCTNARKLPRRSRSRPDWSQATTDPCRSHTGTIS